MIYLLLPAILLQPCVQATPAEAGQPAQCSGIIWSEPETRAALKCKEVDLVNARADLAKCSQIQKAESRALLTRALSAEALLRVSPKPPPEWVLPTVTVGSALLGVAVGFFLVRFTP